MKNDIPFSFWSFSLSLLVMMRVRYACNHWIFLSGTSFHLHWFGATGNCSLLRFCLSLFCSFSPSSFFLSFFLRYRTQQSRKSQLFLLLSRKQKTQCSVTGISAQNFPPFSFWPGILQNFVIVPNIRQFEEIIWIFWVIIIFYLIQFAFVMKTLQIMKLRYFMKKGKYNILFKNLVLISSLVFKKFSMRISLTNVAFFENVWLFQLPKQLDFFVLVHVSKSSKQK